MNILLIDDSEDFRFLVHRYLKKELQDVKITDYDPIKLGKPSKSYDWSAYDVLLLDYKLGLEENGLVWFKELKQQPNFPPTLMLTAEGNEYVAIAAIKLGAADYLSKADITAKRLAELVLQARSFSQESNAGRVAELESAFQIIRDLDSYGDMPGYGESIGYKFVRKIGEGAMSKVYLAERLSNRRQSLVLKILDFSSISEPSLIDRFVKESELLADLSSPYIVQIYDNGITDNYGYIAMEFFSRGDLKHRCERRQQPKDVVRYIRPIARALSVIHQLGIVHRDLKPANIMFRGDDSLALADFGVSKHIKECNELTETGEVVGTPYYMSPEQGQGYHVDGRSDLYSLGIVFYELLTGNKPYGSSKCAPASVIYQHISSPVPRLPDPLQEYEPIIKKLLAKSPDDRYDCADDLLAELSEVTGG